MAHKIRDIAAALSADAFGELDLIVSGLAEPTEAGPDELALAMSPAFANGIRSGRAEAALISKGTDWKSLKLKAAIQVDRPRLALAQVSALFAQDSQNPGIHPRSCVAPDARIGSGCSIGPFTVIGSGVSVGDGCSISSNCTIGERTVIGDGAVIHSGVRIGHRITIGLRFTAHANAVIGSDGFSFAAEGESRAEQVRASLRSETEAAGSRQVRIHSHGTVLIGDDVEIGAATAIDRGTVSATVIGDGTKIDNQVHVAHNVRIGRDCLICGQVGIAGSAVIGDRVVLGGMSGVSDHVRIGDDVVAAGASKIYTRVGKGRAVMGSPAIDMEKNIELYKSVRRLPRLFSRIASLESLVSHRRKDG